MGRTFVVRSVLVAFMLNAINLPAYAQEIVETVYYDSISDGNGIDRTYFGRPLSTSAVPDPNNEFGRSFTGNAINTRGVGPITFMDFYLSASLVPLNTYRSIQVNVQFWDRFGGDLGTDWFANPSSLKSNVFDTLGALPAGITFISSGGSNQNPSDTFDLYRVALVFDSPVTFTDDSLNGVSLNIKGDTGSGFFNTDNLSTFRTRGNGFVVGSSPASNNDPDRGGYLRNDSGRIDGNFTKDTAAPGFDLVPGPDGLHEALGMRLYNQVVVVTVPETNTFSLLALGAIIPIAGLIRRRKK